MIYGTPAYKVDDDQTDKIGIRTLSISLLWQATPGTIAGSPEMDAQMPPPPAVSSGVVLIGQQTRQSGGSQRTSWTFEGINGDGKSVTFKTRANTFDYGFQPGFAQVDIRLHPNIDALLTKYQGDGDGPEVIWRRTLNGGAQKAGLQGSSATPTDTLNPMFGVQDFLRLEGTYTVRYAATSLAGVGSNVGKIFTGGLPGVPPTFTDGRNWLKAPSPYQRRGPVFEITEIYWLSGPGPIAWSEDIYGKANGGGDTSTTSLTIGSLGDTNFDVAFQAGGPGAQTLR